MIHSNKEIYVGLFKNGKQHGPGKFTFQDKGFIEGEWIEGQF